MDRIRRLEYFVRAVELGSLSAAAREAGSSQPTLSKAVAALERELGVRLLERSTTSLAPTDTGRRFYERAKRVLEEWDESVAAARGLTEQPAGLLRVSAPVGLGEMHLNGWVLDFLAEYPDIEVELILDDRQVDLVEAGMELALRLGGPLPQQIIARRVAASARPLVAAPEFLARYPTLREPQDLARLPYLRYAWLQSGDQLELSNGADGQRETVTVRGRYLVNSSLAIREGLRRGIGVGIAPTWLIQDLLDTGELVLALPDWVATPHQMHFLYPSRRYQPLRVRVFMDFLASRITRTAGFTI
ncbi:LysR family transcriptional regulator [Chitinimonas taiwanensis]|uniref:DNA-binding transcriptional regulator, LysR family n=1 Tax=Chitinimonas taiwanensis DSM 18899 TaxID=1121279 RepID=A0A1K2H6Z6_9NEIS|nr:LysR family transcriptional regulator [Chitinimonas taiwanensis]SFZ72079.1 DNA-binding transcriptional regulator, LysR family [Chitinimonas taiwanensis DSM 18899]